MKFIVLQFDELKKVIVLFVAIFSLVVAIIYAFDCFMTNICNVDLGLSFIKAYSYSLTISLFILGFLLYSFEWKYKFLCYLFKKPTVHGLWQGELISSFKRDGKEIPPIEIFFYIKQTYFAINIKSFTKDQKSESIFAALDSDSFSETKNFIYTYKLTRNRNNENKVTLGSGHLSLIEENTKLEGVYWTNAETRGELVMNLREKSCPNIDSFQGACDYINKKS